MQFPFITINSFQELANEMLEQVQHDNTVEGYSKQIQRTFLSRI